MPAGVEGFALGAVTAGDQTLAAGTPVTTTGRTFSVSVTNSGEADETNVEVGITFTPSGGRAVSAKKSIASIAQGAVQPVEIELPTTVRSGQSGTLTVKVGGVPGEEKLDSFRRGLAQEDDGEHARALLDEQARQEE